MFWKHRVFVEFSFCTDIDDGLRRLGRAAALYALDEIAVGVEILPGPGVGGHFDQICDFVARDRSNPRVPLALVGVVA